MKNRIEIEFNRGLYKAFWNNECPAKRKGVADYVQHRNQLIFIADTREQAEQRAKDFIKLHTSIEGYVFL